MIDDPRKTQQLLAALGAALPFEVLLTPALQRALRSQSPPINAVERQTVCNLHYAGDEGGIVCKLDDAGGKSVAFVSLTHLIVPRSNPLAAEVARYQKRRVRRLGRSRAS
jgi:hypothetical protein